MSPRSPATSTLDRAGLGFTVAAYGLWGFLPLYLPLLEPAGPWEIVAHRVVWSLVVCAVVLAVTRTSPAVRSILAHRRTMALLTLAAVALAVNWLVFVLAVLTEHVVDASLGYYINPLVTVALAVVVLRERLRAAQWVALGLGAAAVVVITVGYGRLPWIALVLAISFGLYGLAKNRTGRTVGAVPGLAVETAVLAPFAAGFLVWLHATHQAAFGAHGTAHALALAGTGLVTAVPLLLFGAGARRLPLSVVGFLQYLAPTVQLLIGVLYFGEEMPPVRWAGFALVWLALAVFTADSWRTGYRARVLAARGTPPPA